MGDFGPLPSLWPGLFDTKVRRHRPPEDPRLCRRAVRLWDTAPLKVRYQARREDAALRPEAERLAEALWRQKHDPAEVVEALRADRAMSEPLRQAALRAVLRRAQPPEAAPDNPADPP